MTVQPNIEINVQVRLLRFGALQAEHILVFDQPQESVRFAEPILMPPVTNAEELISTPPLQVIKRYSSESVMLRQ